MTAYPASQRGRVRLGEALPSEIDSATQDSAMSDKDRALRKIEALFLLRQPLPYAVWRQEYAESADLAPVVTNLIWNFEGAGPPCSGMLTDAGLRGLQDRGIEMPSQESGVSLWHPVKASAEEVLAWRHRLQALGVRQPFRQAHRESYALTEADRRTESYSKRFAAHILDQQRFAELCRSRGWAYELQGVSGGFNVPTRAIEAWELAAEFWIEPLTAEGPAAAVDGFPHLTTDQVCFRDLGGERLRLASVPEVVFSEVLRDVEYFVTGSSVGNNEDA